VVIRITAAQGVILGLLTLSADVGDLSLYAVGLALASIVIKGVIFPGLLARALREAGSRREVEPFVGYTMSVFAGLAALGVSLWLGARLPLPTPALSPLVVPLAFFTILSGLFLIVSRRTALTQVQGYLVLENGVYAFGVAMAQEMPLSVELGILLDIFVGVFVMGIIIFHISREFDHIDTDRLTSLKG
jgi:hydrogenase-4 component E